tara:strand:- start:74 stop:1582 length:1509 start_codon:yes stop_codon:yes gene_type:complete
MSKILRRPMFRGGSVSSYGNGIASGLADGGLPPKRGFVDGPGGYSGEGYYTGAYPNPDNLYSSKGVTGAEIVEQAKKKLNTERFPGENQLWKNISKADAELLPGTDEKDIYNLNKEPPAIETWYKKQSPTYVDVSKYESIPHYEEGGPGYIPEELLKIMKDKEDSVRENYMSGQSDAALESQQQLKEILEKQRSLEKAESKHPYHQDEIEVGVSDVVESNTDDGTEMGFQSMADKADSFYEALTGGAEERAAKRLALEEAKAKEKISRARKTDAFNTMLKFFEGSQQEGATVGSSAAEASKYLTSKPSATELAMDKRDTREEALADRAFVLDEKRRDTAGQMAFKDYMQQEAFDFSDVKSQTDFDRKMKMLEKKLKSAETIAEKNIIAQVMRDQKKEWAPGITKKKLDTLASLDPNSKEYKLALADFGFAPSFDTQVRKDMLSGGGLTIETAHTYAQIYYPDYKGFLVESSRDGMFLNPTDNTLYRVDSNGEATPFKKLDIS